MSNLHPMFRNILASHGAVAYQNVAALTQRCAIRVPRVEVTLSSDNPLDPETHRTGQLTDELTQRAYDLLLEDDAVGAKLDAIAVKLARGEL